MKPCCADDWRAAAQRALPRFVFDYIAGGSGDDEAVRRNRQAFTSWDIVPRILRNVSAVHSSVTLFGQLASMPVIVAPTGMNGLLRPGGDMALARAATSAGVPFVLSAAANANLSAFRDVVPRPWLQLYVLGEDHTKAQLSVAREFGVRVLMVTVDAVAPARRQRDLRNGLQFPLTMTPALAMQAAARPRWLLRHLLAEQPQRLRLFALAADTMGRDDEAQLMTRQFDRAFDWDRLALVRDQWSGALMLKGVLHPEDVSRAFSIGIDGVVVSNHGGRQFDAGPASLDMLPEIVGQVKGRGSVFVDGGIQSGSDVLKALGLGAAGVLVGRLPLFGLATAGEDGVAAVLDLLREELATAMALAGVVGEGGIELRRRPTDEASLEKAK